MNRGDSELKRLKDTTYRLNEHPNLILYLILKFTLQMDLSFWIVKSWIILKIKYTNAFYGENFL